MKLGVLIPSRGYTATPPLMVRVAKEAESLGYDYVAVGDHIHMDRSTAYTVGPGTAMLAGNSPEATADPMMWESITTLTYLAAVTKSIQLATHVLLVTARASPVVLAKQIACMDAFSNGRSMIGLGVGSAVGKKELENIVKVPWNQRGEVADEYIQAMIEVWTKEKATFHGKHVWFDDAVIFPKPVRKPHPPLWIGGSSPAAIRRTVRWGDGWCPPSSSVPPEKELLRLREAMDASGRRSSLDLVGASHTCIGRTAEEAANIVASDPYEPARRAEFAKHQGVPVEKMSTDRMVGSPSDIIKKIESYANAGFTHFHTVNFYYNSGDQLIQQLNLFAKEVLPSFK